MTALLWAGCTSPNPAFCETDADCRDPAHPVCDSSISGCVGPGLDGGSDGAEEDGADGADGGAGDEGDQAGRMEVWVASEGCSGVGGGTQDDPYCSLTDALAEVADGGRVVIQGEVSLAAGLQITRDVILQADGEARLEANVCPVLAVMGGARLEVDGLSIGAEEAAGTGGVIQAVGSSELSFSDGRIGSSGCVGLRCVDSDCSLLRAVVANNHGGGLFLEQSSFQVINSMIVENGDQGLVGGVRIDQPGAGSHFVHNTVASNGRQDQADSGVVCSSNAVQVENSILWGNDGAEVVTCPVRGSDLSQADGSFTSAGGNLTQIDPAFVNEGEDYHLQAGSPCRDAAAADPSVAVSDDIDGQPRADGLPDMGADEVP